MFCGNFDKIRKTDIESLQKLSIGVFDKTEFISLEILNRIKDIAHKYKRDIGVVLDRSGRPQEYFLDSDYSKLTAPDMERGGLSTLRLINAVFEKSCDFLPRELNFLKSRALDCICLISLYDTYKGANVLFNTVDGTTTTKVETVEWINKYKILDQILQNEQEFNKNKGGTFDTGEAIKRAILIGIGRRGQDVSSSLKELEKLAKTAGVEVVGTFAQTRKFPDSAYHIGLGKLEEIRELIRTANANLIIIDDEITGQKMFNLEAELETNVIDRAMLILDIFASRATSNEGRLQVKLAQMKYSMPRLSAIQNSVEKHGGGVGMRGPGETKLELARRTLKKKVFDIEGQIAKLRKQRELRREKRKQNQEKVVALVGYTNSGKSSLLNLLTNANVLAEDKLFATLDTTTREFFLDHKTKVLLVDTVGFINKLPHEFIDAFSSTLEESLDADLLLIVVDNSDVEAQKQYEVVMNVLKNLKADTIPRLILANKSDLRKDIIFNSNDKIMVVSSKEKSGMEGLKAEIKRCLAI